MTEGRHNELDSARLGGDSPRAVTSLVVATDEELSNQVQHALSDVGAAVAVRRVEDYLLALGDIAVHGAPDVLVGRPEAFEGQAWDAPATVQALKRLAPRARLVLVTSPAAPAPAELHGNGFDEHLSEPVDSGELARACMGHVSSEPDVPADECDQAGSALTPALSQGERGSIGDTVLLDDLLNVRGHLRDEALALARQRLAMDDLQFASANDAPHADRVAAAVVHQGTSFGTLHAPASGAIDTKQLEATAAWLARWLAMERRVSQLWDMALHDDLTGAWNRRYFYRFLTHALGRAARERHHVTLLLFDIDDFKSYNDRYSHEAGDEILRQTVRLIRSVVRKDDVVARLGGDEFAIVFWDPHGPRHAESRHPSDIKAAALRFQRAINEHKFPKLLDEAPGKLTISGGLATFPWDGRTPEELVRVADAMAMQSKRQGKNVISFGPGADRACNGHG